MRRNPRLFRLTAGVATVALLSATFTPVPASAQPPPPPPLPQPNQPRADQNEPDPPSRVGRIAQLNGTVSFHGQGDAQWSPASVNYPVSAGNTFWTEPSSGARLEIGDSAIVLADTTEVEIATLDGKGLQAVAAQGETFIRARGIATNESWSIQTPRGLVTLEGDGAFDITVGSTEQPTLIAVVEGAARVEGPGVSLHLGAGQIATITGTDSFEGTVGPLEPDPFLTARLADERPRGRPPAPIPAPVAAQLAAMPGGEALSGYGSWSDAPDYGQVWYPPVPSGWVPYREGHWAYVAPWGWTWIDDAPWGFAPFHYGRWIELGGRWAWTPGMRSVAGPPVYAPALVTFVGIGAGVAVGAALASGHIGWVPLGPREPFRPWYHASDRYVREVNIHHTTNSNVTINNFINRGAATSIPAAAMTGSRPVQSVARPIPPQEFAAARPIVGQQPVRPAPTTAGVTPAVARQLNLGPATNFRPTPGPAIRPQPNMPPAAAAGSPVVTGPPGPGNPSFRPGGGPGTLVRPPGAPPVASSPAPPAPRQPPPAIIRPSEPGNFRPNPVPSAIAPPAGPHPDQRPLPQVVTPGRPEPQHFAPPPAPMPRVEQQHFAPPAAIPPHFAPPPQRAEPPRAPPPAPGREKRPGER